MRGLGTDHVISGPMRGLKKTASDGANRQTNRQTDMATLWLNRPSGPIQWKYMSGHCNNKKKSRIRETLNLSNDADSRTNTKTDRNGQKGNICLFFFLEGPKKCFWGLNFWRFTKWRSYMLGSARLKCGQGRLFGGVAPTVQTTILLTCDEYAEEMSSLRKRRIF